MIHTKIYIKENEFRVYVNIHCMLSINAFQCNIICKVLSLLMPDALYIRYLMLAQCTLPTSTKHHIHTSKGQIWSSMIYCSGVSKQSSSWYFLKNPLYR